MSITLTKHKLTDDNIQELLLSRNLPLFQEMVERGTSKLDRITWLVHYNNEIIGYIVTTENFIPYEENKTLKYDALHINSIELFPEYRDKGLGAKSIKELELYVKSEVVNKLTIVGKNDYLTLYYQSIGFNECENGVLCRAIK